MKYIITYLSCILLIGCTTYPNKNVVNEQFPTVSGNSLDGKKWVFPKDFLGQQTIFLIGYKRKSQFDIDRWLLGLTEAKITLPIFELPTLGRYFPSYLYNRLDNSMRSGIPKDTWPFVITIYKDGDILQQFLGTENPNNTRVLLLDKKGKILIHLNEGFSISALKKLLQFIPDNYKSKDWN